jgi:transcription elongation factor, greA/greB, C-term
MSNVRTTHLSQKGFKELHKEISQLEAQEKALQFTLREIGRAKSRDDKLQRNEVIMNLELVSGKLVNLRHMLKTAKPLPRKRDRLRVALGSIVDLVDQQGRMLHYILVDSLEANPTDGRISIDSPLGRSLLDKRPKDTVSWCAGVKLQRAQLVAIR